MKTFGLAMLLKNRDSMPKAVMYALSLVFDDDVVKHFVADVEELKKRLPSASTVTRSLIPSIT